MFRKARFNARYFTSYIQHRFLSHQPPPRSLLREVCPQPMEIGMLTSLETAFTDDLSHWNVDSSTDNSILREIDSLLHRATSPGMRSLGAFSHIAIHYQNDEVSPACVVDLYAWQFRDSHGALHWWGQAYAACARDVSRLSDQAFVERSPYCRRMFFCKEQFAFKAIFLHDLPDEYLLLNAVNRRIEEVEQAVPSVGHKPSNSAPSSATTTPADAH